MGPAAVKRCRDAAARWPKQFLSELTLAEVSGAMGDLGTFLPLLVGLVKTAGLDLGTTLLFTGIYNIITGLTFGIPMPVQPMKTIAAVALAESGALTIPQIMAAGIFVSSCVLFLGVIGMMDLVTRLIPVPVIRGMQLGLGLNLAMSGWKQVWFANGKTAPTRGWWTIEGLFIGIFAVVFILLTVYPRKKRNVNTSNSSDVCSFLPEHERKEGGLSDDLDTIVENKIVAVTIVVEKEDNSLGGCARVNSETSIAPGVAGATPPSKIPALSTDGPFLETMAPWRRTLFWKRALRPLWVLGDAATEATDGVVSKSSSRGSGGESASSQSDQPIQPIIPAALILVILGVILTIAFNPSVLSTLALGPSTPQIIVPSAADWKAGILRAGLPQLPLTTFNSVVSVCQLANALFPSRHTRPSAVAASVGAMNLVGCWFGAMPSCHGAGGLAGQVRFGARTGAAPIFLGLIKLLLSLLLGSSLFSLLQEFPDPLLGAMLVFAGAELASVARGQTGERGVAVMMFTAAVVLAMNNVAIGVCAGLIAAYLLAARDWSVDLGMSLKTSVICRREENLEEEFGRSRGS